MTCCEDLKNLIESSPTVIKKDPDYGWVLCWIELTEDDGYTQVHRYGTPIKYCPMCGNALNNS